ncbi:DUF4190 domain-containing protein [Kitasatospora sp. NPDC085879]|uniref:DUF4190 domain-containing protein n=1 Tax=Kitasatospora sp. NPDC085879 TaxID=3154769 RepID=UPI003428820F
MSSDPYSPQPDDRAAQDEALARAFAPPPPSGGAPVHDVPNPYAPSNPYAPPAPEAVQHGVPPQDRAARDEALARAFAPPPPGSVPPGPIPPGAVPPGAVPPPGAPWGGGGWGQYPGHPGAPGWQQPMGPPTAWSGYAIASFVLGVLGFACCMWVGAIAFGVAALRTVKVRNERGRGLAIAGISLGGVWAVGLAVLMVVGVVFGDRGPLSTEPFDDENSSGRPGVTGVFDLASGECFVKSGSGKGEDVTDVETVDCAEPHYGEVFASPRFTAFVYPGKDKVVAEAKKSCSEALFDYTPDSWAVPEDMQVHFFYPDQETWSLDNDHYATCFMTDAGSLATGSVHQDKSALNDEQTAYLRAEHRVDRAFDEQPDAKPAEAAAAYREWAQNLSVAVDWEIDDLGKRSWGGLAAAPVAALKDELTQAMTHLKAARTATDPKVLERELAQAEELLGFERPTAVRAALGLATGGGKAGGKGGPGAPGGVRTDRPAPVADLRGGARPSAAAGAPARA